MNIPFIKNHQYNLIKKQAMLLHHTCNTVSDLKVVESIRNSVQTKILEAFPDASELQKQAFEKILSLHTAIELDQFLRSLEPYLESSYGELTEQQIRKLFPKIKKLKVPDVSTIDSRYVTYVGWTDIATNKMFLVYHLNGRPVGVEGRFTAGNKKSVCFLCNKHEDVALFSAVVKSKPTKASPDYYKAIGNYMCVNSESCNKNIQDVTALETFIRTIVE